MKKYNIGLFGFGCVGQGLFQFINHLTESPFAIRKIVVKDPEKPRIVSREWITLDANEVLNDIEIDIFVEAIDDADQAFDIVKSALRLGKPVVTANKKMVALHLNELIGLEKEFGGVLLYEAAVCGAIPIIRTVDSLFRFESVSQVRGIFNGTSNYILSAIFNHNMTYEAALQQAQNLGFAETNPESDVGGYDAKYKTMILARHLFGVAVKSGDLVNFGIDTLQADDIRFAKNQGLKIKLIPRLISKENEFTAFVLPQFVSEDDRLYHVENELNGVQIEGMFSGTQFFNGRGAGSFPTAFSVLNDIKDAAARNGYSYSHSRSPKKLLDDESIQLEIYLRYNRVEVKGVLGFLNIREGLLDGDYKYIIGDVSLASLRKNRHLIYADGASIIATGKFNILRDVALAGADKRLLEFKN